jgi:hypothetical protein
MARGYRLTGTFIEACNCTLMCPCWVEDEPTEDYCAGLFAWQFAPGSSIRGIEVGGGNLVSVTVHGDSRRGGSSTSALYVDDVPDEAVDPLLAAFAGHAGGPLAELARVTGDVVDRGRARITCTSVGERFDVEVRTTGGTQLVGARGTGEHFDGSSQPLRLTGTALHREHGIGDNAVTAGRTNVLRVGISALPGPPLDVTGRSSMTGPFSYVHDDRMDDGDGDAPDN